MPRTLNDLLLALCLQLPTEMIPLYFLLELMLLFHLPRDPKGMKKKANGLS